VRSRGWPGLLSPLGQGLELGEPDEGTLHGRARAPVSGSVLDRLEGGPTLLVPIYPQTNRLRYSLL
jgi:hypothetical protein